LQCQVLSRATEGAIRASRENPKGRNRPSFDPCFRHLAAPLPLFSQKSDPVVGSRIPEFLDRLYMDNSAIQLAPSIRYFQLAPYDRLIWPHLKGGAPDTPIPWSRQNRPAQKPRRARASQTLQRQIKRAERKAA
jgi:hypothetical protein